jgi:hypothetical protein
MGTGPICPEGPNGVLRTNWTCPLFSLNLELERADLGDWEDFADCADIAEQDRLLLPFLLDHRESC